MRSALLVVCCLGFAVPLAVYLLIGANMRYSGDDYCYAANLSQHGFWDTQRIAYQQVSYYNGNRFSLNLASALADLAGPYASSVWPSLAILVWLAGAMLALSRAASLARVNISILGLAAAAQAVVFFTLALAPDIDQSLFWRSGMLTYLAPVLASTYLVAILLYQAGAARLQGLRLACAALLAFLGAGFSETGALVQAAWLGLALLLLLGAYWRKAQARPALSSLIVLSVVAWLATLAALTVLAASPTVTLMKPQLAQPQNLAEVLQLSMLFTRRFLSTLKTAPLQNALPVVVFAALTYLILQRQPIILKVRPALLAILLIALAAVTYGLVLSSVAAYTYAQQAYPEPRAVVIPRFILTLAQAAAGCLLGLLALELARRASRHPGGTGAGGLPGFPAVDRARVLGRAAALPALGRILGPPRPGLAPGAAPGRAGCACDGYRPHHPASGRAISPTGWLV